MPPGGTVGYDVAHDAGLHLAVLVGRPDPQLVVAGLHGEVDVADANRAVVVEDDGGRSVRSLTMEAMDGPLRFNASHRPRETDIMQAVSAEFRDCHHDRSRARQESDWLKEIMRRLRPGPPSGVFDPTVRPDEPILNSHDH